MNSGGLQPVTTIHTVAAFQVPAIVAADRAKASRRFLEFYARSNIRNPRARRAYGRAVTEFLTWCDGRACRRSRPSSRFTSRGWDDI
jgi:hypothetical protein